MTSQSTIFIPSHMEVSIPSPSPPRKENAINYLTDNHQCTVGGLGPALLDFRRLAILVEDGHIIFFERNSKRAAIEDALVAGVGAAAMSARMIALPVLLAAWAVHSTVNKMDKSDLIDKLHKIQVKFKLSDDEIFISHPEKCSVELSGKNSLLAPSCKVHIQGLFLAGKIEKRISIWVESPDRPNTVAKIFAKGDFPVSYAKE